jgi:hypothetical protein
VSPRGARKKPKAASPVLEAAQAEGKSKTCRRAPADSENVGRLTWRFSWIDHDGPWGWKSLPIEKIHEILDKLAGWEAKTWPEVLGEDPHNQHYTNVENLTSKAQQRLEVLHLDDLDQLFRFRFMKKERLWGVAVGNVFYLLWWDPDHDVYG